MPGFLKQVTAKNNRLALWISLLAALGGFLFGFDTGVVGGALPLITMGLHVGARGEAWVAGSLLPGVVAGALVCGFLADRIGRKWTVFAAACVYVIGAIAWALCSGLVALGIARDHLLPLACARDGEP